MTDLRTAALRALEAMDELHRTGDTQVFDLCHRETTEALRSALGDPQGSDWRAHAPEYEKGFIDGMSEQARRSVDRFVNAMAAPIIQPEIKADKEPRLLPWKGLTEEEHTYYKACGFVGVKAVEEKLRAKNSTLACIPAVPPG
jgi:hypothetical protein